MEKSIQINLKTKTTQAFIQHLLGTWLSLFCEVSLLWVESGCYASVPRPCLPSPTNGNEIINEWKVSGGGGDSCQGTESVVVVPSPGGRRLCRAIRVGKKNPQKTKKDSTKQERRGCHMSYRRTAGISPSSSTSCQNKPGECRCCFFFFFTF